ncbi:family 16 glycosylhydrolase [Aquimarina agarivorans]|uniref:family 16 glycosylhydrolase n=1 Tax=Aquimarina agarivorans TaxID=980584 RepID=UPI000248E783|nr:family 16 glycosylhydrolase [Aquimarina agarivorans]
MRLLSFKKTITFFTFCISTFCAFAQPSPPEGKKWEIVANLSDEFDHWDDNKWRTVLWDYPVPNKMKAENSGVTDGKLWIRACVSSDDTTDRWFETSRIYGKNKISFPMYIECSMKTAHISAYNTFWLNNGNAEGRDEIDICENMSNPINNDPKLPYLMQSQYFIVENSKEERSVRVHPEAKDNFDRVADFDNRKLSNSNPAKGKKWNEDFQTFGLYWKDAHTMIYYINGEQTAIDTSKSKFTRELDVIWDLWTHDHDGGFETKERLKNMSQSDRTMYVDFVHTYTLTDK